MVIQSSTNGTIADVIKGAANWRPAVDEVLKWLVENNRSFSSGEVAAYLRRYRPDLAFQQNALGEYVREQYDNGLFPSYLDTAGLNPLYPTQVPRTTTGIAVTLDGRKVQGRSPAGITVFVYAPEGADGFAHDFETYIPDWRDPEAKLAVSVSAPQPAAAMVPVAQSAAAAMTPAPAAQPATSTSRFAAIGVLITGNLSRQDLVATVRKGDLRVQVPRAAFETWVNATGRPLRGGSQGDPVHVLFTGTSVDPVIEITRDPVPGSQEFHLWMTRGRLALHAVAGYGPFAEGDKYEITVDADKLTIDLSKKV